MSCRPEKYVIEISLTGFARTTVGGVVLSVGQELVEDIILQLETAGLEVTGSERDGSHGQK